MGEKEMRVICPKCGMIDEIYVYERIVKHKIRKSNGWQELQKIFLEVERVECPKCGSECKIIKNHNELNDKK